MSTQINAERFYSRLIPEPNTGCLLWIGSTTVDGYGTYGIGNKIKGDKKIVRCHRLAWELAHGRIPKGLCVLHKCDTPACCNTQHLFLGSNKDNVDDRQRKGRNVAAKGSRQGNSILSEEIVLRIRKEYNAELRNGVILAKKYGVTKHSIHLIVKRKAWKHV